MITELDRRRIVVTGTATGIGLAAVREIVKQGARLGVPFGVAERDLCPVLVFRCGAGARFITGQLISVDGGMRMLGA